MSGRPLTIGVIGGMGPAATFDFCARLTALAPAKLDQDHPRVLVDCDPSIPDRNAAMRGEGPSPGPVLADKARALQAAGARVLAMPCNAAHAFAGFIVEAATIPFVDMIAATVGEGLEGGATRVGVLAADGAMRAGLYQRALAAKGVEALTLPDAEQAEFMALIYRIKAGELGAPSRREMARLAVRLVEMGAQALIAGCTEVPLVLDAHESPAPLTSSTDALARATLKLAFS